MRPLYGLLLLVTLVFACCFVPGHLMEKPTPTVSTVPGNYRGEYMGGVETVEVRSDFKYVQEFRKNGALIYRNEGAWHIAGNQVVFDNFLSAVRDPAFVPRDMRDEQKWGMWVDFGGGCSIVFDIDRNHTISRMKTAAEKDAK